MRLPPVDFTLQSQTLTPTTPAARTWVADNIRSERVMWNGGFEVPPCQMDDIVFGIVEDGFRVGNSAFGAN